MLGSSNPRRLLAGLVACFFAPSLSHLAGQNNQAAAPPFPSPETLRYMVEWRLVTAGAAAVKLTRTADGGKPGWHVNLRLESTGLVSKLYKVEDTYDAQYDAGFCADAVHMISAEGRRRRDTKVTYERTRKKAVYLERDLVKNANIRADEIDIPACVHDVLGALIHLRTIRIDPGKSAEIPVSDGKKSAMVRVEAQEREDVRIKGVARKTMRYEAFLFNGVIYARKASILVWLTEDANRTPVQIRLRLPFPIGTITLTLDKQEFS